MKNKLTPAEKSTVIMLLSTQEISGITEFIKLHGKKEEILQLSKEQFPAMYSRIYNLEIT